MTLFIIKNGEVTTLILGTLIFVFIEKHDDRQILSSLLLILLILATTGLWIQSLEL